MVSNRFRLSLIITIIIFGAVASLYLKTWFMPPTIQVQLTYPAELDKDEKRWLYLYITSPHSNLPLSYYQTRFSGDSDNAPELIELRPDMYLLPTHRVAVKMRLQVIAKISSSSDPHAFSESDIYLRSRLIYPLWNLKPVVSFNLNNS